ncbi:MAG: hypothetical protein M1821_005362 [Bathelium mastoideum]|nr:MAG: hypothetical protein M1821_005362 [Bathelium mastoideum]KAI9688089.1 MAG: hypothetical protein M1822_001595 [Bathelium mastoideum]
MKFFGCTVAFACVALVSSAVTTSYDKAALAERDAATDEITLVTNLYNSVLPYDADINSTVKTLNADSTAAENATAEAKIRSDIEAITSLINSASTAAKAVTKRSLEVRQITPSNSTIDLADILVDLLFEVDNTVNTLVNDLGLSALDGLLTPLEDALTSLVGAVGSVVDGVVNLVVSILDGVASTLGTLLGGVLGGLTGLLGGLLGGLH